MRRHVLQLHGAINAQEQRVVASALADIHEDEGEDAVRALLSARDDTTGDQALHLACKTGHMGVLSIILSRVVELNCIADDGQSLVSGRDGSHNTPVHICIRRHNLPALGLLLASGRANINMQDHYGLSALELAVDGDVLAWDCALVLFLYTLSNTPSNEVPSLLPVPGLIQAALVRLCQASAKNLDARGAVSRPAEEVTPEPSNAERRGIIGDESKECDGSHGSAKEQPAEVLIDSVEWLDDDQVERLLLEASLALLTYHSVEYEELIRMLGGAPLPLRTKYTLLHASNGDDCVELWSSGEFNESHRRESSSPRASLARGTSGDLVVSPFSLTLSVVECGENTEGYTPQPGTVACDCLFIHGISPAHSSVAWLEETGDEHVPFANVPGSILPDLLPPSSRCIVVEHGMFARRWLESHSAIERLSLELLRLLQTRVADLGSRPVVIIGEGLGVSLGQQLLLHVSQFSSDGTRMNLGNSKANGDGKQRSACNNDLFERGTSDVRFFQRLARQVNAVVWKRPLWDPPREGGTVPPQQEALVDGIKVLASLVGRSWDDQAFAATCNKHGPDAPCSDAAASMWADALFKNSLSLLMLHTLFNRVVPHVSQQLVQPHESLSEVIMVIARRLEPRDDMYSCVRETLFASSAWREAQKSFPAITVHLDMELRRCIGIAVPEADAPGSVIFDRSKFESAFAVVSEALAATKRYPSLFPEGLKHVHLAVEHATDGESILDLLVVYLRWLHGFRHPDGSGSLPSLSRAVVGCAPSRDHQWRTGVAIGAYSHDYDTVKEIEEEFTSLIRPDHALTNPSMMLQSHRRCASVATVARPVDDGESGDDRSSRPTTPIREYPNDGEPSSQPVESLFTKRARRIAFVGKERSGKERLINSILGTPLLSPTIAARSSVSVMFASKQAHRSATARCNAQLEALTDECFENAQRVASVEVDPSFWVEVIFVNKQKFDEAMLARSRLCEELEQQLVQSLRQRQEELSMDAILQQRIMGERAAMHRLKMTYESAAHGGNVRVLASRRECISFLQSGVLDSDEDWLAVEELLHSAVPEPSRGLTSDLDIVQSVIVYAKCEVLHEWSLTSTPHLPAQTIAVDARRKERDEALRHADVWVYLHDAAEKMDQFLLHHLMLELRESGGKHGMVMVANVDSVEVVKSGEMDLEQWKADVRSNVKRLSIDSCSPAPFVTCSLMEMLYMHGEELCSETPIMADARPGQPVSRSAAFAGNLDQLLLLPLDRADSQKLQDMRYSPTMSRRQQHCTFVEKLFASEPNQRSRLVLLETVLREAGYMVHALTLIRDFIDGRTLLPTLQRWSCWIYANVTNHIYELSEKLQFSRQQRAAIGNRTKMDALLELLQKKKLRAANKIALYRKARDISQELWKTIVERAKRIVTSSCQSRMADRESFRHVVQQNLEKYLLPFGVKPIDVHDSFDKPINEHVKDMISRNVLTSSTLESILGAPFTAAMIGMDDFSLSVALAYYVSRHLSILKPPTAGPREQRPSARAPQISTPFMSVGGEERESPIRSISPSRSSLRVLDLSGCDDRSTDAYSSGSDSPAHESNGTPEGAVTSTSVEETSTGEFVLRDHIVAYKRPFYALPAPFNFSGGKDAMHYFFESLSESAEKHRRIMLSNVDAHLEVAFNAMVAPLLEDCIEHSENVAEFHSQRCAHYSQDIKKFSSSHDEMGEDVIERSQLKRARIDEEERVLAASLDALCAFSVRVFALAQRHALHQYFMM